MRKDVDAADRHELGKFLKRTARMVYWGTTVKGGVIRTEISRKRAYYDSISWEVEKFKYLAQ